MFAGSHRVLSLVPARCGEARRAGEAAQQPRRPGVTGAGGAPRRPGATRTREPRAWPGPVRGARIASAPGASGTASVAEFAATAGPTETRVFLGKTLSEGKAPTSPVKDAASGCAGSFAPVFTETPGGKGPALPGSGRPGGKGAFAGPGSLPGSPPGSPPAPRVRPCLRAAALKLASLDLYCSPVPTHFQINLGPNLIFF